MTGKPYLAIDASILDDKSLNETMKMDVELNRISFEFPQGLSTIPLIEECRALNSLDDFDLMYDISMQLLTEKQVLVYMKDYSGTKRLIENFIVTDRYMDLRGVHAINETPVIVNWLVSFLSGYLRKKYPRPSVDELRPSDLQKNQKPESKAKATKKK